MRKLTALAITSALLLCGGALSAAPPGPPVPPAPASPQPTPQALSPAVQTAISELSSDDFKTREAALKKLQVALGEQMRALVMSDDPEVQARMASLLEFNEGLTRWILETYRLPNDQRKAEIEFGLRPEILPVLALAFSSDTEKRVEGAKALAKIDNPTATAFLGRMLNDPERAVYIAAMEGLWDAKPSEAIVDALWERAVEAGLSAYRGGAVTSVPAIKFRGRAIGGVSFADNSFMRRAQDSGIAADVLINFKSPLVVARLKTFLDGYAKATDGSQPNNMWLYSSNSEPIKNAFRIIESYKSKEVVGALYKIATGPVRQRQQGQMNTEKYFWSNRTTALASLIAVIDQKPEDYDLKRQNFMGGVWTAPTEADEEKAVKKIQAWWAANSDKFEDKKSAKTAKTDTPASQPAAEKAEEVPPANAPVNIAPGVLRLRGNVRIQVLPAPAPVVQPPANDN